MDEHIYSVPVFIRGSDKCPVCSHTLKCSCYSCDFQEITLHAYCKRCNFRKTITRKYVPRDQRIDRRK